MNTLAHLAALVAIGFIIRLLFVTLSEPILGTAAVVVFVTFAVMTIFAVEADKKLLE